MIIDNGKFIVHNIIVGADPYLHPLLHQKTRDAVGGFNLRSIQIDSYLYSFILGIYKGGGYFFISKDIHSYIDEGLGLVDISGVFGQTK